MKIVFDNYPFKTYRYANNGYVPSYRKVRFQLAEDYGVCYWCGKKTKEYPLEVLNQPGHPPHDQATIDHLKSRNYREKGEVVPKVLACHGCNWDRAMRGL